MIEKIKKVIPIIFAFAVVSGSCTAFAADIPIYEWEQETPYIEEQTTEDSKESAGLTEMSYAEEQIQEQVWEDFQDVYHEEVPEQLQEEMPEQNQEEVPEQLQEETPEQYTATGEGTNDYTDLSEVGFQSTTVKQMSQLPLEIKLETQDTIPAWTMYKEVVEIRNITTLYMNNIDLKLKCTDYGLNITPFKNTDDAQYELSTVNIFDEQGCLKPEYAERTLRISSLAPGESIKAEIVLWAYWDITPDEQGFNASAQVEFSEGTDRVSAQGKWKVAKPEKTEIKEPTEALQEAEVYDQQIDEVAGTGI